MRKDILLTVSCGRFGLTFWQSQLNVFCSLLATPPAGSISITQGDDSTVIGDLKLRFTYSDNLSGVQSVWLALGNGRNKGHALVSCFSDIQVLLF